MKIAYLGQKGIPMRFGGIEKHVEQLAASLAHKGHEVFVYARSYYTPRVVHEYRGVKIIHLPTIRTKYFDAITHTFFASIHALFKNYDIIHYQGVGPALLSFLPRLFCRRAKVVVTFHCQDRHHEKWGVIAKAILFFGEWASCRFPHLTITVSEYLQRYCLDKFHKKTIYLPNAIISQDDIIAKTPDDVLNGYDLNRRKYFLIVSRLIPHKNIEEAIRAFSAANLDDYKLVICGDGFFTDKYVAALKKLAFANSKIIFTGNLTGELVQLYQNAVALLLPSKNEGLSYALLEALSYGLPVILRNNPENKRFIEDGIVYSYDTPDELLKYIKLIVGEYWQSPEQKFIRQKYVQDSFSLDKVVSDTENLYRNLVGKKSA